MSLRAHQGRGLCPALASHLQPSSGPLGHWSLPTQLILCLEEKEAGFPNVGPRPSQGLQICGHQAPNPQLPLKEGGCHGLLCKSVSGMV